MPAALTPTSQSYCLAVITTQGVTYTPIDRLSQLPVEGWQKLKAAIDSNGLAIVSIGLHSGHKEIQDTKGYELFGLTLGAINSTLEEMMTAITHR